MSQETVSGFPWLRLNSGTTYRSADRGRAALARSGFGTDDGELNLRRRCSKVIRSPVQWDRCVNLRRGSFKLNISLLLCVGSELVLAGHHVVVSSS